jgi:pyruvate dehydrogenase complex dehydrogenase (E1) component
LFEVDAPHIAAAALAGLARDGRLGKAEAVAGIRELGVNPEAVDPRSL